MSKDHFLNFVLDQLSPLEAVRNRKMFGGYGIYCDDIFFGIIYKEHFFMKTNEKTRQEFIEMQMSFFQPNEKQGLRNYYEVPLEVLENRERVCQWANTAIDVARSLAK